MSNKLINILFLFLFLCTRLSAETEQEVRAKEATDNMFLLKNDLVKKDLGISRDELYEIALYIEEKLRPEIVENSGYHYLRKESSGLARTIECCPNGLIFIHLKTHGIAAIGRGGAKKVTYSIMYDNKAPELVANSIIKDKERESRQRSIFNEKRVCEQFKNRSGICHCFVVTAHAKPDGSKPVVSFLQKLNNGGTLKKYFCKDAVLTKQQLIQLALDYMLGIRTLHRHDLIHGDLHLPNFMIDIKKRDDEEVLTGVLIDFGKTITVDEARNISPKIQGGRRNNPPELFLLPKEAIDPKAVDLYAMGLCLYRIYFQQEPEWTSNNEGFCAISTMEPRDVAAFGNALAEECKKSIAERRASIDGEDAFAECIFLLCDPEPKKRGSARKAYRRLQQCFELVSSPSK